MRGKNRFPLINKQLSLATQTESLVEWWRGGGGEGGGKDARKEEEEG